MRIAWCRALFAVAGLAVTFAAGHVSAQAPAGTLVLYTSQPERDAAQTVGAFRKVHPGVDVEVFRSGTTEVMGKLTAEFAGGHAKADVLLLADAATMEALKKAGRLLPYPDAKLAGLEPGSYDVDKTYFGSKLITTGIAVNASVKARPASFADLAKPDYKAKMTMPSPLYSGAAAIMLGTMTTRADLGWAYFEKLKSADAIAVRGNGAVLAAVANGEKSYGILVDFMAFNAKAKGSPIDFVFPAEGSPAVTEPVAILKTASNIAAAKAFVDFILSDTGQKLASSQGYVPAKSGIPPPAWLPPGAEIDLMPLDMKTLIGTIEADKKKFADLFGG